MRERVQSFALEFREGHPANRAESRCESCGALRTADGSDHHAARYDLAGALRYLADVWLQDERIIRIVFMRLLFPHFTYRMLAPFVGAKRATISKLVANMRAEKCPLYDFVITNSAKARGQRKRREVEREQKAKEA